MLTQHFKDSPNFSQTSQRLTQPLTVFTNLSETSRQPNQLLPPSPPPSPKHLLIPVLWMGRQTNRQNEKTERIEGQTNGWTDGWTESGPSWAFIATEKNYIYVYKKNLNHSANKQTNTMGTKKQTFYDFLVQTLIRFHLRTKLIPQIPAAIYMRKDVIGLRIISQSTSERCVQSGDRYQIGL